MPQVSVQAIDAFIESEWEQYVADLARLISIDSSLDKTTATKGAPFGAERAALDEMLVIADRMGLETHDGEGYAGYADLCAGHFDAHTGHVAAHTSHTDVYTGYTDACADYVDVSQATLSSESLTNDTLPVQTIGVIGHVDVVPAGQG